MKHLILVLLAIIAIAGCTDTATTETEPEHIDTSGVTRTLPDSVAAGETFTVTLTINMDETHTFYIIEEEVPETVVVDKETDSKNRIKLVELEASGDSVYTYQATAPEIPGQLTFDGRYAFDNMEEAAYILGDKTIEIR